MSITKCKVGDILLIASMDSRNTGGTSCYPVGSKVTVLEVLVSHPHRAPRIRCEAIGLNRYLGSTQTIDFRHLTHTKPPRAPFKGMVRFKGPDGTIVNTVNTGT